eukprot:1844536-Rhodomonas_salina.1
MNSHVICNASSRASRTAGMLLRPRTANPCTIPARNRDHIAAREEERSEKGEDLGRGGSGRR